MEVISKLMEEIVFLDSSFLNKMHQQFFLFTSAILVTSVTPTGGVIVVFRCPDHLYPTKNEIYQNCEKGTPNVTHIPIYHYTVRTPPGVVSVPVNGRSSVYKTSVHVMSHSDITNYAFMFNISFYILHNQQQTPKRLQYSKSAQPWTLRTQIRSHSPLSYRQAAGNGK
ncbi:hypothetical protein GQR58_012457 [Nymphon striatum]|nr:hypothetical protein GQR58_012457 [Nymphon striatum]